MRLKRAAIGLGLAAGVGCLEVSGLPAAADVIDAQVAVGGRGTSGDRDSSKFEEYQDLEQGFVLDLDFLLEDSSGTYYLRGGAENATYDDQRYRLEGGRWGDLRLFAEYSEIPHVFSNEARTLYSSSSSGVFDFPDFMQTALQGAPNTAARSTLLGGFLARATRTSLRYQVRTGQAGLVYDPSESVRLETSYRILDRHGRRPFSMGFGSPGGNFAAFAKPIDEETDEFSADVRMARGPWNLEVGYLGSFFDNDVDFITVDNPLRITDAANASSRGRLSTPPDNSLSSFHVTSAYDVPLQFPARVAATFAFGKRKQYDDFLPHTINALLAGDPGLLLPRDDLDGSVETYSMNVVGTARPLPNLDFRARYRFYAHDNETDVLLFPAHTINDQGLSSEPRRNVPSSYERHTANLDASYRITPTLKLRGGPFWERWSRSRDREVSELDEYGGKLALDYRPATWASIRGDYLVGVRTGTAYNPWDYLEATLDPAEVPEHSVTGQLAQLRKLDEADRTRNEFKLLAQLIPRDDLDLSLSGAWSHNDYPHSQYGLRGDERWNAGTEIGYQPHERVSISAWYDFEHLRQDQRSRWRPVSGSTVTDDPVNDWASSTIDIIHAAGLDLTLTIVPKRLDLNVGYSLESGTGKTHSTSAIGCLNAPISTPCLPAPGGGADGGNAANAPNIKDRLHVLSTSLRYTHTEHVSFDATYGWQKLSLTDFHYDRLDPFMPNSNVNGSGVVNPSLDVFLGDRIGDYDAHIFTVLAIITF